MQKLTARQCERARDLIRSARVHPLPALNVTTLDFATLEQIAPSFECDADLESFLRRNSLDFALSEYLNTQRLRATQTEEN